MIAYFEDVAIGEILELGTYTRSRPARSSGLREKFDPQPFHLSEEGASRTHFRASLRLRLAYGFRFHETVRDQAQISSGRGASK